MVNSENTYFEKRAHNGFSGSSKVIDLAEIEYAYD